MKLLHILNGDSSAKLLAQTDLPGDRLVWREALVDGPVDAWADSETFFAQRAEFIAQAWGAAAEAYTQKFVTEFQKLAAANQYDEIILWFEHDLFCQVNLLFVLNWFVLHPPTGRLSLICPGSHPEVEPFYGLGQLSPAQFAALFPGREMLTSPTLAAGAALWQAFASPDPLALQALIAQPQPGLPHVQRAMRAHLAEFPAVQDGLSAIERFILQHLAAGPAKPGAIFGAFMKAMPVYGLGDLQFFARLRALMPHWLRMEEDGKASLTEAAQQLLKGQGDRTSAYFSKKWIGGCKLSTEMLPYRWNSDQETLVSTAPAGANL